ncbi:MAG: DUF1566 domain-containing protein [Candidatus Nitronauta litoralis]|uniref:DUF1566 domain-containing protein n=1 Tax=Candidatus Nitronauta litoralis TaxID=2705533 RepID=A0A7T0BTP6_9BACT|nr:MAG: DUF1566 domain-containing protein [Candidatus Nitronauta litoralis]
MKERFEDHGNGTIRDADTGLMWQESYAYGELGNYMTWYDAVNYISRLNSKGLGGYKDWRLPNRLEMQSLYLLGRTFESRGRTFELHIDPIFEFGYGSCFWTWREWLSGALSFSFDQASLRWFPKGSPSATVRAVRENLNPSVLLKNLDGTVHGA